MPHSIDMSGEVSSSGSAIDDTASNDGEPESPETKKVIPKPPSKPCPSDEHYMIVNKLTPIPMWVIPCHLVTALFQILQSLFLFAFCARGDLVWLVYTNYPAPYDPVLAPDEYARPEPQLRFSYNATWLVGFSVFVAGLHHMLCVISCFRDKYVYYAERQQNPMRWIEYSFTCPIMKLLIAQVAGVTDLHLLIFIMATAHVSMYFPLLHEQINAKARAEGHAQNWTAFFCGTVPHMVIWGVIFSYFFSDSKLSSDYAAAIVISLFFMDLCFPVCFCLQWKQVGVFEDYMKGEFGFIVLSFTSKTFLAWIALAASSQHVKD